jgi:hypothetical protein
MKKLKKRMEAKKKMGLFGKNKNRKTQEELNEEFAKLNAEEDTGVEDSYEDVDEAEVVMPVKSQGRPVNVQKPVLSTHKTPMKAQNSLNKPVLREEHEEVRDSVDEGFSKEIKGFAEDFNEEFAKIVEPDKQFNMLFALYVEQKRTNKLLEGISVLLEDLNQKASE